MADISLSNLDYSARSSRSHDLEDDASTQTTWIDFDRDSTLGLLPFFNHLQPNDSRGASSEVEYIGNDSNGTLAQDALLGHRHDTTGALARQGESDQGVSSLTAEFATSEKGWWKQQMLVDRSLRSMAALTGIFALAMVITCLAYLPDFVHRINKCSTSVGGSGQSCESMERADVRLLKTIHLLINIAATMTLGMSNTYQQLITSLKVDEIRWMLSKHEDSRVGTNSPMTINHKKNGKISSLLAWLLLIATSLPLHLLANSVIGPSYYITPTQDVQYSPVDSISYSNQFSDHPDVDLSTCWIAFRTGSYFLVTDYSGAIISYKGAKYTTIHIEYSSQNCTQYKNSTTLQDKLGYFDDYGDLHDLSRGQIGNCSTTTASCTGSGSENPKCRLNIRMSAALTLAGCLLIKAIYMIVINISARHRTKRHCLTFGDILVASAMEAELQIHNECLVNAGDGHRHHVEHTCHEKHCSMDSKPSITGDDIGHCQKCTRFNIINKAADLPHPYLSTKYKKSLISNLGSTAVSQMMILMVCSLAMLSVSIMLANFMASSAARFQRDCDFPMPSFRESMGCDAGLYSHLKESFGTFGGFQGSGHLSSLPPDSLRSEMLTFIISNGAQLIYSLLYLLLIYNITLISMERDWGNFEKERRRPRCTLVKGDGFDQSYMLQLPKKVLYPIMTFSAVMHWLLGQAISTSEIIWVDPEHHFKLYPVDSGSKQEHSMYTIGYGIYSIWLSTILMIAMTTTCWWVFTYKREGFMPQMYGSIRACCSATTELRDFPRKGIQWGDLGTGENFRHAGFSGSRVDTIMAGELYCGRGS